MSVLLSPSQTVLNADLFTGTSRSLYTEIGAPGAGSVSVGDVNVSTISIRQSALGGYLPGANIEATGIQPANEPGVSTLVVATTGSGLSDGLNVAKVYLSNDTSMTVQAPDGNTLVFTAPGGLLTNSSTLNVTNLAVSTINGGKYLPQPRSYFGSGTFNPAGGQFNVILPASYTSATSYAAIVNGVSTTTTQLPASFAVLGLANQPFTWMTVGT
jgi:hypothetical protein